MSGTMTKKNIDTILPTPWINKKILSAIEPIAPISPKIKYNGLILIILHYIAMEDVGLPKPCVLTYCLNCAN